MATPEGAVKRDIKKYLATLPRCWFYMPVQNGMGMAGIPDIVACIDGRFVGIECKAPGRGHTVTSLQENALSGIQGAGGVSMVAESVEVVRAALVVMGLAPTNIPARQANKRVDRKTPRRYIEQADEAA